MFWVNWAFWWIVLKHLPVLFSTSTLPPVHCFIPASTKTAAVKVSFCRLLVFRIEPDLWIFPVFPSSLTSEGWLNEYECIKYGQIYIWAAGEYMFRVHYELIIWPAGLIYSSNGKSTAPGHQHRRSHGFESRSSLIFFKALSSCVNNWEGLPFYLIFHPLFKIYVSYIYIHWFIHHGYITNSQLVTSSQLAW